MKVGKKLLSRILLIVFFSILPIFFHGQTYVMHILIMGFLWAAVASCWDLVMGYAGVFNLGQIVFLATGGVTSAMLATHLGISPWIGLLAGGGAAFLLGLGTGALCVKLTGWYAALFTLALHLVYGHLLAIGKPLGTGGTMGLLGLPTYNIGGFIFGAEKIPWYFLALALFLMVFFSIDKVIHSKLGTAFMALRDSRDFARSLGINERKFRIFAFGISAGLTGIVGAFYAHYIGMMSPRILGLDIFILGLLMIVIGGEGNFPGPAIGGFAIVIINELLRMTEGYRLTFFGGLIVLLILFMPKGLSGMPVGLADLGSRLIKLSKKLYKGGDSCLRDLKN